MNDLISTDVVVHDKVFEPMIGPEEIRQSLHQLARTISADMKMRNPLCISILNGAFIFAADLVRLLDFDPEIAFLKVKSYRDMQSTGEITELIGLDSGLRGRDILVIEDIIDTGHTISYLDKKLRAEGASSVTYAALLMKSEAYRYDIAIKYVAFQIPNRFVVGYGLDYNGYGRALPGIYVLKDLARSSQTE